MKSIVIADASVLLTALFGSNDRTATKLNRLLHDDASLVHILPFTIIEFANGVRFSTRDVPAATRILKQFNALTLPVMEITSADVQAIVELSYRLDTTVYDTAYHHMALMQGGVFVTCDKGYFKKASTLGHVELWG
ncbi:MAG: type II toxin-antitoxin system VapC family toxin [Candidatus Gottesmanbacteria bacterium]|nr:type II toxin-antitoxin system VapC family toxin [Candidatus Gottesmanbacteria bacterium]